MRRVNLECVQGMPGQTLTVCLGYAYDMPIHIRVVLRIMLFIPLFLFFVSTVWGDVDEENRSRRGYAPGTTLTVFGVTMPWYYQSTNPGIAVPALWVQWTECIFRQRSPLPTPANFGSFVTEAIQSCLGRCMGLCCRCGKTNPTRQATANNSNEDMYETVGILPYGWFMYTATAATITYNFVRLGWGVPFSLLFGIATYFFYPLLFLAYSRMIVARHSELTQYQKESIVRGIVAVVVCTACLSYAAASYRTHWVQAQFATRYFGRDIATLYMAYECLITSKAVSIEDLE